MLTVTLTLTLLLTLGDPLVSELLEVVTLDVTL
jgi:hypothetical protein